MVINLNRKPEQLNSFVGDLLQTVISPTDQTSSTEADRLATELYYKEQDLAAAQSKQNITMAAVGIFGLAAAYFGYKSYKK